MVGAVTRIKIIMRINLVARYQSCTCNAKEANRSTGPIISARLAACRRAGKSPIRNSPIMPITRKSMPLIPRSATKNVCIATRERMYFVCTRNLRLLMPEFYTEVQVSFI